MSVKRERLVEGNCFLSLSCETIESACTMPDKEKTQKEGIIEIETKADGELACCWLPLTMRKSRGKTRILATLALQIGNVFHALQLLR